MSQFLNYLWDFCSTLKIFNISRLEVGKTRFASPGSTIFSFDENISLVLPQKVLDNLLKTLGADAQKQVPCSITTELVFTIGGAQLKVCILKQSKLSIKPTELSKH